MTDSVTHETSITACKIKFAQKRAMGFRKDESLSFIKKILSILNGTKTRLAVTSFLYNFLMISFVLLRACLEKNSANDNLK